MGKVTVVLVIEVSKRGYERSVLTKEGIMGLAQFVMTWIRMGSDRFENDDGLVDPPYQNFIRKVMLNS